MRFLVGTLFLIIIATNSNAQISYDYVEVGYKSLEFDPFELTGESAELAFGNLTGDGVRLEGSFSFGAHYFAFAEFDFTDLDLGFELSTALDVNLNAESVIERNIQSFGVGYHTLGRKQFVASAAFLRQDIDSGFFKEATLGYVLELGGRGLLGKNAEWETNVNYTDFDAGNDSGGEPGVNAAFRYHFGNRFSTDLSATTSGDEVTYGLNFRFNFSR